MSGGWIKLEKALREDIRVKRIAAGVCERFTCNGAALQSVCAVTLVLGALAQLWMHADTFARDDDTLDITCDEIDQLAGIEGFAKLMPSDWLEILDAERVKLPGFQGHNGVLAKRRALGSKRVSKHRTREKRDTVTQSADPVTLERYQTKTKTKTRLDQTSHEDAGEIADADEGDFPFCDPTGFLPLSLEQTQQLRQAYPTGIYRQSEWLLVERLANHHMASGHAFEDLLAGATRYRAQCEARESIGTQYVLSPVKFFDRETPQFNEPFPLPKTKAEAKRDANIDASLTWLADQEAQDATG